MSSLRRIGAGRARALLAALVLDLVLFTGLLAAEGPRAASAYGRPGGRQFAGTSLFVLTSLIPEVPSLFAVLDYGYELSDTDVLLLGADLWRYASPMGNPWAPGPSYPGSVLSSGLIVGYQRFSVKGLYASVMLNPLILDYSDEAGGNLGLGFQLLGSVRLGYHFEFPLLGRRFYLEPAAEFSWWPVNLGVPPSFAEIEARYPNFVPAPGLNFGLYL